MAHDKATHTDDVEKLVEIIKDTKIAMLTTHGPDGLESRPLSVTEVGSDADVWFFTAASSDVAEQVSKDPEVNAAFSDDKRWVSLSGKAKLVTDVAKKKELWNSAVATFFSHEPESPEIVLIQMESDSAQYWENPGGVLSLATSWVKGKVTGEPARPGDSATLDL
ncbi:pyridoxamine 5'-phosphate oxidase family protein [Glutamicibacter sp. JC586]|uniref:pyridoxamine 5'-phosphate oxidase family protein n=1 Tax=Glutamicibacter sp. JC586 TaxID=2590552 RepID=UPI0013576EEE|nr:pyridoxamine 5'-phosphate oxidase family protein [Glutamicibacter sp. JC586]